MSSMLLPFSLFITMRKDQITTRMLCTEDLNLDACINYCDMYQDYYPGVYIDKYECLQKYLKIPPIYFADIKCKTYPYWNDNEDGTWQLSMDDCYKAYEFTKENPKYHKAVCKYWGLQYASFEDWKTCMAETEYFVTQPDG